MSIMDKKIELSERNLWIGVAIFAFFGACLRFWNLGEFQKLVFDEVYFPKFAYDFLNGTFYFDVHPPLSKYIIGIGIMIYNHLPWVHDPAIGSVPIEQLSATSWRWINALAGTIVIFVGAGLAKAATDNKLFTLIVTFFLALEGSLIVESRFGLNNIYIVLFGLSAMWALALAFRRPEKLRKYLIICGIFLGMTYSIKWNGLGYSATAWGLTICAGIALWIAIKNKWVKKGSRKWPRTPFPLAGRIPFWEYPIHLIVLPFVVYAILWIPHLKAYDKYSFWDMQYQIRVYHSKTVLKTEHPYCSRWYQWPILQRPISYLFEKRDNPEYKGGKAFYDVHLLGNPVAYWLGTVASIGLIFYLLHGIWAWKVTGRARPGLLIEAIIVSGFLANWLPWMMVSRCLFQYHYLPSAVFSFLGLAWCVTLGLQHRLKWVKTLAISVLVLFFAAFIYWLPFHLALPLDSDGFYSRMWFRSWI